ncbi:hypothetical protein D6C81_04085 [Aureobasidium pullulans]|nr:hypothetical protein D6C81_04085 [Aureobasidium pullulans]
MPYHFFRPSSYNTTYYSFASTSVPNDTSFGLLISSNFVVYDRAQGLPLLGDNPTCEKMFEDQVTMAVHEAPVYVPGINKLFMGVLEQGYLPQLFVDLNQDPPALSEFESDPPIYAPNGGTYHGGLVYWGAGGDNHTPEQRHGIRVLDPTTNKTTTLLNNYFGSYHNGLDDLFVDSHGDIWFTDPDHAWNGN